MGRRGFTRGEEMKTRWGLRIIRFILGGVFIYAAISKIGAPQQFADNIASYQILPFAVVNVMAMGLPWFELICGLSVLTGFLIRMGALGILAMLGVFIVALAAALLRGLSIDCGCFGIQSWDESIPWIGFIRDSILLLLALWIYTDALRAAERLPAEDIA
jgi:putative oxidoreductase